MIRRALTSIAFFMAGAAFSVALGVLLALVFD
jgi:hypothetical protein